MLQQGLIIIDGESRGFIDRHSELCIDGKPCNTLGDAIYTINGHRVRERDFKQYRKFSPQFRSEMIMEYIQEHDLSLTACSCSCSKCGTVAMDEAYWI